MTDPCFRDEDLELLAKLRSGDPQLDHEKRCGRCRARLATFREFMAPCLPPEANEKEGVAKISETMRAEIWGPSEQAHGGRGAAEAAPARGWPARFRSALWLPALRPVWVVAAAVLLVLVVRQAQPPTGDTDIPSSLRGESEAAAMTARSVPIEGGDIRVTWDPVDGADAYQLIVLDTGLIEILCVDAGTDLSTTLEASSIDALPDRDAGLLWRVVAFRHGTEVARSALHSIDSR